MSSPVSTAAAALTPRVSRRRRSLAACIDFLVALAIGLLASSTLGHWAASRAAVMLRVGEPDSLWRGPAPLLLGAIGNLTYALPLVLLLVVLPEATLGVGPGKSATGLRIVPLHRPRSALRMLRYLVKCVPGLAWLLALSLAEPWTLALFVASLLWFTVGCLPWLRGGQALHDRLAGTQVVAERSPHM